ncbi:Scr1 family TA system antitoxin-like transcriptional regulator [Streptomyces violaceusniger]|uniref:Scr1 family TA system antitoxin-like transcriptional regulator n=1 Tax=Streptomyces violaceusniger TaxID=68280 RepID=UPI0031D86025
MGRARTHGPGPPVLLLERGPAGLLDLAELEHHAAFVRVATVIHVPGLLQTREHARALFDSTVPPLPPHAVEHRRRQPGSRPGAACPRAARPVRSR